MTFGGKFRHKHANVIEERNVLPLSYACVSIWASRLVDGDATSLTTSHVWENGDVYGKICRRFQAEIYSYYWHDSSKAFARCLESICLFMHAEINALYCTRHQSMCRCPFRFTPTHSAVLSNRMIAGDKPVLVHIKDCDRSNSVINTFHSQLLNGVDPHKGHFERYNVPFEADIL